MSNLNANTHVERDPKASALAREAGQPALSRILDLLSRLHDNQKARLVEIDDLRTYVREAIRLRAEEDRARAREVR